MNVIAAVLVFYTYIRAGSDGVHIHNGCQAGRRCTSHRRQHHQHIFSEILFLFRIEAGAGACLCNWLTNCCYGGWLLWVWHGLGLTGSLAGWSVVRWSD